MGLTNIVAFDYSGPGERKWKHRQKMERKELDRYERGSRRTAQYERMKGNAPLTVRRMRKWLKSPYAFRHPLIPVDDGSRGLTARALQKFREAMREHVL